MSEFHHILEKAALNIEPVVVVATGFCDDLLQTFYVNNKRRTLNIVPVKLIGDESFINSIVDISVVAGTDPVNSLKGELISSIDYDSLPIIDNIEIKKGSLLMGNSQTENQTRIHLERIRQDFNEKANALETEVEREILQERYNNRFRSLSSRSLHISAGKNLSSDQKRNLKIDIDRSLRVIREFRKFGCIKTAKFKRNIGNNSVEEVFLESFMTMFKNANTIPASCIARSIKICHENAKLLSSTAGAVLNEHK